MKLNRLFGVLVIGGSLLATQPRCGQEDELDAEARLPGPTASGPPDAGTAADAGEQVDAGSIATFDAGVTQPDLCFCGPAVACCESHDGGASAVRAGFFCCWGTSC